MMKSRFLKAISLALTASLFVSCTPAGSNGDVSSEEPEPIVNAEEHLAEISGGYRIISPDKSLVMDLGTGDVLCYSVSTVSENGTTQWIKPSNMGVTVGNFVYGNGAAVKSSSVEYIKENRTLMGNQDMVKVRCIESVFVFENDGKEFKLEVRLYNDGVAFRYLLPEAGTATTLSEQTTYDLRDDVSECWYSVYTGALGSRDYETAPESHDPNEKQTRPVYAPMTAIVGDNQGYISIMEGDINSSYPGTTLSANGDGVFGTSFMATPQFPKDVELVTPWRLINIANDLNGIVNNYNIYSLSALPDETVYADTSWIEGGRSTWSWVCEGFLKDNPYKPGEIMWAGAPTEELMMQYIDIAAKLGFEYNIVDDGWPAWGSDWKEALKRIGIKGEENNVKQILWGAVTSGTTGYNKLQNEADVNEYIELLKYTHMYGGKIDFWWDESDTKTTNLQQYMLFEFAKAKMLVDFHGCNKNSGFNITYPNEINREGIHGGEYYQMPETKTDYTKRKEYASLINGQLYTRFLCGHADWTPGTYNGMELASMVVIDSPLMVIASKPSDILNSPAVEFIKSMPTTWDKTRVLSDSRIGKYSVYAKEKDGVWFVGGLSSDESNTIDAKVNLSEFLPEGTYAVEVWYDEGATMKSKTLTVTNKDVIDIGSIGAGDGFAMRLSQMTLSQYGGEIKGDIIVTAPEGATVKFTVDGTDPMTSDTAKKVENGKITLTSSCRMRVAITDGTGKGTAFSYQFNKLS